MEITTGDNVPLKGINFFGRPFTQGKLIIPPNMTAGHYTSPVATGIYTFKVSSYNSVDNIYSTGFASGSINSVTASKITNVLIGGLTVN